jgi:outer membrane protein OmpA-like peptidoglycan-associated protein
MTHLTHTTLLATGMLLALGMPAHAADSLYVDGYAKNSSGETWTSSSGECVRTRYEDSQELLASCGYERVVTETVEVDNQPAGAGVAVVEETAVMKDGAVLAASSAIVAETFIENLEFGFDSDKLSAADQAELDGVIVKLDQYRQLLRDNVAHVNVIGYTDSRGADAYNMKLSERRAQTVADYLEGHGKVRPEVLRVSGKGEADPIGDNNTDEGRRLNRRVVLEVVKH